MKEHKTQILAALALALALGMAVPGAVFASEGTAEDGDAGIALLADGATKVATSTELFNAITTAKKDANFSKYQTLYNAQTTIAKDLAAATEAQVQAAANAVKAIDSTADVDGLSATELNTYINSKVADYALWSNMLGAINTVVEKTGSTSYTAELISQKMNQNDIQKCYDAVSAFNNRVTGSLADNIVKLYNRILSDASMQGYRAAEPVIAGLATIADAKTPESTAKDALATVRATLKTLLPSVEGIDTMEAEGLAAEAEKGIEKYAEYTALYNSMGFIREAMASGTNLTAKMISDKYSLADQQSNYNAMATAAAAIDPEITSGLWAYKLPNTSVGTDDKENNDKPNVPDTGIVGLIETGALDLGTLTLIVSVAVAGIAGVALIAKLYLKHKF